MLNLYPYLLMVNSVYTSGFKHPCSVGVGWGGGQKEKGDMQYKRSLSDNSQSSSSVLFPFMNIFSCVSTLNAKYFFIQFYVHFKII